MTFPYTMQPCQYLIDRKKEVFGEWSKRNLHALFLPYRDPNYSLEAILHLMMNRLHQSYETLMTMEQTKRDNLFNAEYELMKREAEANKNLKK